MTKQELQIPSNCGSISIKLELPYKEALLPWYHIFIGSIEFGIRSFEDVENMVANWVRGISGERKLEFSEFRRVVQIEIDYIPAYRNLKERLYWWLYRKYSDLPN